MNKMDQSLFHVYSLGYVVEDNHKDCFCEPVIKVLPLEFLTNEKVNSLLSTVRKDLAIPSSKKIESLLNDEEVKIKIKDIVSNSAKDIDWKLIDDSINITRGRWMTTTWISFGTSNEYNAPCLNRGDIVIIYRYGDMDAYFWELIFKRTSEPHKTGDGSFKRYISGDKNKTKIEKEVSVSACTNTIAYKINCHNYTTNIFNYLNMENGNLEYIDQKGNMLSVNQDGVINLKATKNIVEYAKNNMFLSCNGKMDLAPSKMLSVVTKDIIVKASNGVSVNSGHMFTVKAAAITLQGNVVINGNLAVMGSVVPGSCPCCCLCPAGGGGGGSVSTPAPDKGYKSANSSADSRYNKIKKNKESFINKVKAFAEKIYAAIVDKAGKGN